MREITTVLTALLLLVLGAPAASALSFTLGGSSITKINASMPGAFDLSSQFYSPSTFAFTMTVDSIEFSDAPTQQMSGLGNPLTLEVSVTLDTETGFYTNAIEDMALRDVGVKVLLADFTGDGGEASGLGVNFATATLGGTYTLNGEIVQPDPALVGAMFQGNLSGQIDFSFFSQFDFGGPIVTTSGGTFSMIPNPEPSTALLLGLGLVGLALKRRSLLNR